MRVTTVNSSLSTLNSCWMRVIKNEFLNTRNGVLQLQKVRTVLLIALKMTIERSWSMIDHVASVSAKGMLEKFEAVSKSMIPEKKSAVGKQTSTEEPGLAEREEEDDVMPLGCLDLFLPVGQNIIKCNRVSPSSTEIQVTVNIDLLMPTQDEIGSALTSFRNKVTKLLPTKRDIEMAIDTIRGKDSSILPTASEMEAFYESIRCKDEKIKDGTRYVAWPAYSHVVGGMADVSIMDTGSRYDECYAGDSFSYDE